MQLNDSLVEYEFCLLYDCTDEYSLWLLLLIDKLLHCICDFQADHVERLITRVGQRIDDEVLVILLVVRIA